jgi:predicted extracellular nuclease
MAFLLGSFTSFGQVIISQVYEGLSYNKFLEITNIGTSPVNLASPQLTVKTFNNKVDVSIATSYSFNLSGTLAPGQCLLVRHHSAAIPAYALTYTPGDTNSAVANFNGTGATSAPLASTDIIALYNGTTLVDVFAWGTFQYKDQSFYRNANVSAPNPTWTVGEWTGVTMAAVEGAATGTTERLGFHVSNSTTTPSVHIASPANGSTVYT